ncbi:MAG: hypothetical protein NC124_01985 [Clostridium sp.]|nr:hypothetical protein [Clostridium sp.]MCM1534701.1 hypothetical protein [Clostridium sp.]
MKKYKVNILLMRFPDNASKAISFFKQSFYTHVSIGLEEDLNTFYSFVWKGFLVEKITRYAKSERTPCPCLMYELEVSEKAYQKAKKILLEFESNKDIYHYAKLGVVLGIIGIPLRQKNRYFCSQFVAEVLEKSNIQKLKKNSALYYPNDFNKLSEAVLVFQGSLKNFIKHYNLCPATI